MSRGWVLLTTCCYADDNDGDAQDEVVSNILKTCQTIDYSVFSMFVPACMMTANNGVHL
jgi:hypothetical protein